MLQLFGGALFSVNYLLLGATVGGILNYWPLSARCIDFELMAKTITDCGADIVGLNEMRGEGPHPDYTDQVPTLAALTGLSHHYFAETFRVGGENPYGNGLLSRYPIERVETISIPMPDPRGYDGYYEPRCVLKATL